MQQVAEPVGDIDEASEHRVVRCIRQEHRQPAHHPDATLCQLHGHDDGETSGVAREQRILLRGRISVPA